MTPKLLKLKKFSGPDSEQNRNPAHIIQVSQVVRLAEYKRCLALAELEHISLMTMTIKTLNLSLVCLLALGSVRAQAQQQDTLISKSRASILVPRPALQPIKSLDPSSATPIDTLDTGNPAVKILLMENYTWKYYKDPSVSLQSEIYNTYWDDVSPKIGRAHV